MNVKDYKDLAKAGYPGLAKLLSKPMKNVSVKQYKELTKPRESTIQTEVMGWLRAHGWYTQRMNSGKYAVGEGVTRRFIRGHDAGTPDIEAFKAVECPGYCPHISHGTEHLFIEVKRPGEHPTALQIAKMKELTEYGVRCLIVHSIAELEEKIC